MEKLSTNAMSAGRSQVSEEKSMARYGEEELSLTATDKKEQGAFSRRLSLRMASPRRG
jgi:hypothetical protein